MAIVVAGLAGIALLGTSAPKPHADPPADLEQLLAEASRIKGLRTLLAQRDGRVLVEGYFGGAGADDLFHLRSATKSVMSLLIGIALDRGDLESVDQTLGELLGRKVERFGSRKAALTLEQLLTMSAGLEWHELDNVDEFNRLVTARDPLAHYLERPFVAEPGERWAYSSGASHVLSVVLSEVTGVDSSEYARRHLFKPLGIERFRWRKLADGHANGSASLELRARDMLKLGQLVLQGGRWEDRQVVSREWLEAATRVRFQSDGELHYGYQWWLLPEGPIRAWLALGYAGQTLVVLPEAALVVQANCRWRSIGRTPTEQSREVQLFLRDRVLPFVAPEVGSFRAVSAAPSRD